MHTSTIVSGATGEAGMGLPHYLAPVGSRGGGVEKSRYLAPLPGDGDVYGTAYEEPAEEHTFAYESPFATGPAEYADVDSPMEPDVYSTLQDSKEGYIHVDDGKVQGPDAIYGTRPDSV